MSIILTSITSSTSENSISIITKPTKLNYKENDTLDLTGLAVKFYQKDKQPIDINSFTTEPANGASLTRNDNIITIKYSKDGALYIAYLPINIKYPTALEVAYLPKTSYREGDTVDTTGLKMMLMYNDNSKEMIDSGITSTPAHGAPIGNNKFIEFSGNINGYVLKTIKNITVTSSASGDLGLDATREYVRKKLCTWAGGSWSEIYEMIKLSKDNIINLKDYWKVGDEKVVWVRRDNNTENANAEKYNKTSKFNPEVQTKLVIIEITKDFRRNFFDDKNTYYGEVIFTPKTYYPLNVFDLPLYRIVNKNFYNIFTDTDTHNNYGSGGVFCAANISGSDTGTSFYFGSSMIDYLYRFDDYKYTYGILDFYTDIDTNFYKTQHGSETPADHKFSKMIDGLFRSRILLKHIFTDARKTYTGTEYDGITVGPAVQYTDYKIFKNCTLKIKKTSEPYKPSKSQIRYDLYSILYEAEVSGSDALSYYRTASNRIIEAYNKDKAKEWPNDPKDRTLGILLADLPSENFDGINYGQYKTFTNIDFHAYSITGDNYITKSKLVFNGEAPKVRFKYINRDGEVATINPFVNEQISGVKLAANPVFVI